MTVIDIESHEESQITERTTWKSRLGVIGSLAE